MDARFKSGDEVRLKSQPDRAGRITSDPVLLQGEYWYPIYFGPGQTGRHPESDLEPYTETTDPLQLLRDSRFAGREAFSKLITQLKLATALRSHIYALQALRTTFYPHQFKPVLKFLESWKHRLLIADEVGLGKTIEAGLILTEFRARFDLDRVLIVPPSHLITKWQQEMKKRFDLDFEVLDKKRAIQFLARFEEEGEATQVKGILSLQTLRGRELQDRWEAVAPTFNLVIFDEAGRLRHPETLSNKAARLVGEAADGQLLLTATPIQTSEADLFNLLALLDPDEFGNYDLYRLGLQTNASVLAALRALQRGTVADLQSCMSILEASKDTPFGVRLAENPMFRDVTQRLARLGNPSRRELIELQSDLNSLNLFGHHLNRTRQREVEEKRPLREAKVVPCSPTEDEIEFYNRVTNICLGAYSQMRDSTIAAFATMMPQRQVASCMVAMLEYTRDRLGAKSEEEPLENSDFRPEDFDPSEKGDGQGRIDWRQLGNLDERRIPSAAVEVARMLTSSAVRRYFIGTLKEAYAKETPPQEPKWRDFPILLMGGGSEETCFEETLGKDVPLSSNVNRLARMPSAFCELADIQRSSTCHRLAVSHGLSFPRALWPRFLPPSKVPVPGPQRTRTVETTGDNAPG